MDTLNTDYRIIEAIENMAAGSVEDWDHETGAPISDAAWLWNDGYTDRTGPRETQAALLEEINRAHSPVDANDYLTWGATDRWAIVDGDRWILRPGLF